MNVSCPQCKTVFRVDPRKVPAEGVRARCSVCGGVFEVVSEKQQLELAAVAVPAAPEPAVIDEAAGSTALPAEPITEPVQVAAEAEPEAAEPERVGAEVEAEAAEPPPEAPAAAPAEAPSGIAAFPFGKPDQEARARRLARALISDLAAYHPERQEQGLKEGRLKELFQDDLRKSWQEYADQVGLDVAKSTPYFRDALNEILAKGKRVF